MASEGAHMNSEHTGVGGDTKELRKSCGDHSGPHSGSVYVPTISSAALRARPMPFVRAVEVAPRDASFAR